VVRSSIAVWRWRWRVAGGDGAFGELGQIGGQEPVEDAGQEHRAVQAVVGDLVSVCVGDLFDEPVGAEAPQVVGHLPCTEQFRWEPAELGGDCA
jgi:hypothetical protein